MADLPENPNNREEEYLADLAGQDGTKPNKPWSRKEAYLDAIDGRMDGIDAKIAALATDISLKGSVADYDHLPTDAAVGDAYITEDTGILYVWVGDEWTPLNMQGGGGIKELTTDDYDWPTNNPSGVALWKLPEGLYSAPTNVKIYYNSSNSHIVNNGPVTVYVSSNRGDLVSIISLSASSSYFPAIYITSASNGSDSVTYTASGTYGIAHNILRTVDVKDVLSSTSTKAPLSAAQGKALNDKIEGRILANAGAPTTSTVGTVGQLLEDTTNGKLYQCTAITPGTDPDPDTYTWEEVGGASGPTVVQTTGTSTTDVMSQDAVSSKLYAKYNGAYQTSRIKIGDSAMDSGVRGVAIGANASTTGAGGIALGTYSKAENTGEMNIGSTNISYGYNSSNYRLLTGLYDPQSAHDAATKGYVDNTHAVLYADVTNLTDSGTIELYKEPTLTTKWNAGEIGDLLLNGASISMVSKKSSESGYDTRHNYQIVTCYYPYIIDDDHLNETDMRMVFREQAVNGHITQYTIQTGGARIETVWSVGVRQI